MSFFITIKNNAVHYIRFGTGESLLLSFHGFDEDATKFKILEPALGRRYTVISFDLPFHGKTKWTHGEYFNREDLKLLVENILESEGASRFSLMGNSLGGKIALTAIEEFADRIDALILIAPDGVKANAWYNVAVYPKWGQKLFSRFVKKPQFIFSVAKGLNVLGIISDKLLRFLKAQTDTAEKRQKIYDSWITVKELEPSLLKVKALLNQYMIKSFIFIGKYDQVITPKIGREFSAGLNYNSLIILERGHNLITDSLNDVLSKEL